MYGESEYLFRGLSEETLRKILELGCEASYGPGECVFRENEVAENFYILNQGRIRLSAGRRLLLAHVASSVGDVIGWSSLVGNSSYTSSAECMTATRVTSYAKQQVEEILAGDPRSGMNFFKNLAAMVGQRLVRTYLTSVAWEDDLQSRPAA
jgi:CRP-like cAMP-binding protein